MKRLTEAQQCHLKRIARGVEFHDTIPEWRLVHMGLITIEGGEDGKRYAKVTKQAEVLLGVLCAEG